MSLPPDVIDRPLVSTVRFPLRFCSWFVLENQIPDAALIVREWSDPHEQPLIHLYAVSAFPDELIPHVGIVYGLVRLNPTTVADREDGSDADYRVYRTFVPRDSVNHKGSCDCRGWRLFRRCRHLESLIEIAREPPKISEEVADSELASWLLSD